MSSWRIEKESFSAARRRMVDEQLLARGTWDPRVLEAFRAVPRERFVPANLAEHAYDDCALPIGAGQTISQPAVVALMVDALELRGSERVLEVGTGSGYAAAVLSHITSEVYTVERIGTLSRNAESRLRNLGYDNIRVVQANGSLGWIAGAPYDAILVSAATETVPSPLLEQLAIGGRLVMPLAKDHWTQRLIRVRRLGETEFAEEDLDSPVVFVPLVGAADTHR